MARTVYPKFDIAQLTATRSHHDILNADRFKPYLAANPHLQVPHTHSFYHIVFFTAGKGEHVIDFERFAIRPGMIYFMKPGQVHNWHFTSPADGYIINFAATFFDQQQMQSRILDQFPFFGMDVAQQAIQLDRKTQASVSELFLKIVSEQATHRSDSQLMIASLLMEIFVTVNRSMPATAVSTRGHHNMTLLKDFQQLIEANFTQLRLPKDYASLLHITPAHLNTICKETAAIPAGEMIRDRILLEAKRLLVNFDMPVGRISEQLHFPDHSYFVKFFKKYAAMTPESFRNTHHH